MIRASGVGWKKTQQASQQGTGIFIGMCITVQLTESTLADCNGLGRLVGVSIRMILDSRDEIHRHFRCPAIRNQVQSRAPVAEMELWMG